MEINTTTSPSAASAPIFTPACPHRQAVRVLDLISWPSDPDAELDRIIEVSVERLRQDYKMGTQGVGRLREQLRQYCLAQMNGLAPTPPARR